MGSLKLWQRSPPDSEVIHDLVDSMSDETKAVVMVAARALQAERVRRVDRRLLIILVLVVGIGAWLLHSQSVHFDKFRDSQTQTNYVADVNCGKISKAFTVVGRYQDGQEALIRARTDLSPAVKKASIANIEKNRLGKLTCASTP